MTQCLSSVGQWANTKLNNTKEYMYNRRKDMSKSMKFLGFKFLFTIFAIEHVLQGFIYGGGTGGLIGIPIKFLLRSFGTLSASRIQVLMTIAVSPWALKPILGMLSDAVYVGGYNKIPYIIATLLTAIMACLMLVFTWPLSPVVATLLFFVLFLQISLADLLLEAKYADKVRDRRQVNSDMMSFVELGCAVGQLFSLVVTGLLIMFVPLKYIYMVPIVPFCLTLYPIYNNWIDDVELDWHLPVRLVNICCDRFCRYRHKADPSQTWLPVFGLDAEKIAKNWRIFLLGLIITAISVATNIMGLLDLPLIYLFVFSLLSAPAMIVAFFCLTDRRIAMIQTYTIVQNMCTISLEGATFFFFTDRALAYPEGPHFSDTFYITGIGITAALINILGVIIYAVFMSEVKFRHILLATNVIYVFVSLPNIVLFNRWNRLVGIPDELFVLGTEALQVIIAVWGNLPLKVIMNHLCPDGVQATSYALLAGSSNLGNALSQYQGAFILDVLSIRPKGLPGESAQFANLWIASLISIVLSVLPSVLIPFLIPDASQSDYIIEDKIKEQQQKGMEKVDDAMNPFKFSYSEVEVIYDESQSFCDSSEEDVNIGTTSRPSSPTTITTPINI